MNSPLESGEMGGKEVGIRRGSRDEGEKMRIQFFNKGTEHHALC